MLSSSSYLRRSPSQVAKGLARSANGDRNESSLSRPRLCIADFDRLGNQDGSYVTS